MTNKIDDLEGRAVTAWNTRYRDNQRFVEACNQELLRQQGDDLEILRARALSAYCDVTAKIAAAVADGLEAVDDDDVLLRGEDLADLLQQLLREGRLRRGTPFSDQLESFYRMDYPCTDCGQRPGIIPFSAANVCIHCYLHH